MANHAANEPGHPELHTAIDGRLDALESSVGSLAVAADPNVIYLDQQPGYDKTGATDMWSWLDFHLANWANQGKVVKAGPATPLISRTLSLPNMLDFRVSVRKQKWLYKGPIRFALIPIASGFVGDSLLQYGDGVNTFNFCHLENFVGLGQAVSGTGPIANIDGLRIVGETFGLELENCGFRRFGKWGVRCTPIVNGDGSGFQSRGHRWTDLNTESCGIGGIDTDGLTDSDIVRHHAHTIGNATTAGESCGAYIRGGQDLNYLDARHTFSRNAVITGDSTITQGRPNGGGITISNLHTDRMTINDILHKATGTREFTFKGGKLNRGGRVNQHDTVNTVPTDQLGSWSIRIEGTAPVVFDGVSQQLGEDDSYTRTDWYPNQPVNRELYSSPAVGVKIANTATGPIVFKNCTIAGRWHSISWINNSMDKSNVRLQNNLYLTGTTNAPVWSDTMTA